MPYDAFRARLGAKSSRALHPCVRHVASFLSSKNSFDPPTHSRAALVRLLCGLQRCSRQHLYSCCAAEAQHGDYAGAKATALLSVGIGTVRDIVVTVTIHLPALHGSIEKGGEKPIVTSNAGIFPASSSAEGMTPFYASRSLLGAPGTMGDSRDAIRRRNAGALRMRHCSLSPRWVLQQSQHPSLAL